MKSEMSRALAMAAALRQIGRCDLTRRVHSCGASVAAAGERRASRHQVDALNNWLRQVGSTFASLAMEFLGFDSPETKEGLASHPPPPKSAPSFSRKSPF